MTDLKSFLQLFNDLSDNDRQEFISNVISTPKITEVNTNSDLPSRNSFLHHQMTSQGQILCPHCDNDHIVKNGHSDEMQRYKCKKCGKTFNLATKTILADTKISLATWRKCIECMMEGMSVRKTASICEINPVTAFRLRHKILDALQNMHKAVRLDGIVESDETYFRVSYKGNHKQDDFVMPREPRKRGNRVTKAGLSNEHVCIPCAVSPDGKSISKIATLGKSKSEDLINVLGGRLRNATILCCDGDHAYNTLARHEGVDVVHFPGEKRHNGIIGIQHVNNYHSRLKEFLRPFHGVSTKYMNNYLVWNNLTVYAKEPRPVIQNTFFEFTTTTYCTTRVRTMAKRPAVPVLTGYSKSLLT